MPTIVTLAEWEARAVKIARDTRPFIGGRRVEAQTSSCFETFNPHDGSVVAKYPGCGTADVSHAVTAAREAFESGSWSSLAPSQRAAVLSKFADLIDAAHEELALADSLEMGKPIRQSVQDVRVAADSMRGIAGMADKLHDAVLPSAPSALSINQRVPHGVVAAIAPWNFPMNVAVNKIAAPLAVGNSVVLKPSEIASLSCLRLGDLAVEAGIPPGVLNVVPGLGGEAGKPLALHMDVDCLTFTGSTTIGQQILQHAGQSNLKVVLLECGGKSPQIVLDDCGDMDALAESMVQGFVWNSGQLCVSGTRILVARSLKSELLPRLVKAVKARQLGSPLDPNTDLGPVATPALRERISRFEQQAVSQGAVSHSSEALLSDLPGNGCYVKPSLLTDVNDVMEVMRDEVFGPVAGVMWFDSPEEAVRLANNTRYGLAATVWTADIPLAHRLVRELKAGIVVVNTVAQPTDPLVSGASCEPMKMSGFGVEGGMGGLLSYTRMRNLTFQFG
ncbi:MAG: aldehyde dehydrogenase family protein [Sterolibacterium sp.]